MKMVRSDFHKEYNALKGYQVTKLPQTTFDFFKDMEGIQYELCKIALGDAYLKRYLKSYVAAGIFIQSFVLKVDEAKVDSKHIQIVHQVIRRIMSKLFGYNKYVQLQVMGKFLIQRFQVFYF
jgi:hypothetical protein